eukprot:CAMPEP_0174301912 /NCGR_PEP_ID=MMETSP0809-20121228/59327_1 /TAXON_ID=73025 ORGANISM="Eutreptiella gymnastica-like, Strain CCMP1594" /NCGR_SAMPLE_ID=MMETSP0809 /ASSEMBLY_ACC=CAM_ASM_000658 /LENGTH=116 /DNA_ID=CAMNT_0015407743 /DNA_START=183 /DNA_END=534 /DNA_ORIENTATION=+
MDSVLTHVMLHNFAELDDPFGRHMCTAHCTGGIAQKLQPSACKRELAAANSRITGLLYGPHAEISALEVKGVEFCISLSVERAVGVQCGRSIALCNPQNKWNIEFSAGEGGHWIRH